MANVERHGKKLRIQFYYEGKRCRESLGWDDTSSNRAWAESKANLIQAELDEGTFNYAQHFPDSSHAKETTLGPYIKMFLKTKSQEVAGTTYDRYKSIVSKYLQPKWGHRQADDIDGLEVE